MFLKRAVRGKMFLDCFQLGLEKVKPFKSIDRPNATHKLLIMWNLTLELFEQRVFPLFFLAAVFGHELNFDWANLIFVALSPYIIKGDSCPRSNYFLWFIRDNAAVALWIVFSTFHWCFWNDRRQSIFVGLGVGGKTTTMDWQQALYFLSSPRLAFQARLALRAKSHVRLAWLIKRLLCRLNADQHSFSRTRKVLLSNN